MHVWCEEKGYRLSFVGVGERALQCSCHENHETSGCPRPRSSRRPAGDAVWLCDATPSWNNKAFSRRHVDSTYIANLVPGQGFHPTPTVHSHPAICPPHAHPWTVRHGRRHRKSPSPRFLYSGLLSSVVLRATMSMGLDQRWTVPYPVHVPATTCTKEPSSQPG